MYSVNRPTATAAVAPTVALHCRPLPIAAPAADSDAARRWPPPLDAAADVRHAPSVASLYAALVASVVNAGSGRVVPTLVYFHSPACRHSVRSWPVVRAVAAAFPGLCVVAVDGARVPVGALQTPKGAAGGGTAANASRDGSTGLTRPPSPWRYRGGVWTVRGVPTVVLFGGGGNGGWGDATPGARPPAEVLGPVAARPTATSAGAAERGTSQAASALPPLPWGVEYKGARTFEGLAGWVEQRLGRRRAAYHTRSEAFPTPSVERAAAEEEMWLVAAATVGGVLGLVRLAEWMSALRARRGR
ncbi:hypothetical protein MMPV_002431 [Pyropia vietnamensis]